MHLSAKNAVSAVLRDFVEDFHGTTGNLSKHEVWPLKQLLDVCNTS